MKSKVADAQKIKIQCVSQNKRKITQSSKALLYIHGESSN